MTSDRSEQPKSDTYDEFSDHALGPLPRPDRALTIGAHPDDAEFGAGATLARWASEGTHITMLVVTDGSKGSWDSDMDPTSLAERRRTEQQAAASVLGAAQVVHLDHVDGELVMSPELRHRVALEIRRTRPDIVLSHDPWQRYQMHPDHRATGFAAVDGVVSAREPMAMTETGLPSHRPDALLLWSADEPDHAEPVTSAWFEVKLRALMCHSSQAATTMAGALDDADAKDRFTTMLREWHEANGRKLGTGPAEVFKRLTP